MSLYKDIGNSSRYMQEAIDELDSYKGVIDELDNGVRDIIDMLEYALRNYSDDVTQLCVEVGDAISDLEKVRKILY